MSCTNISLSTCYGTRNCNRRPHHCAALELWNKVSHTRVAKNLVGAQVDLYENGTIAIVEAVSPELGNRVQRVRVQLPGTSQELLQRFREKSVDFAAHSNTEDGGAVFLNLLGALQCLHALHGFLASSIDDHFS